MSDSRKDRSPTRREKSEWSEGVGLEIKRALDICIAKGCMKPRHDDGYFSFTTCLKHLV